MTSKEVKEWRRRVVETDDSKLPLPVQIAASTNTPDTASDEAADLFHFCTHHQDDPPA